MGVMIQAPRSERAKLTSLSAATSEAPPHASELASTWATLPGGVVDGGEIVILAIKPSLWRPLLESTPWMLACCVLAVALVGWERPLPGLSITATAQMMLLIAFSRLGFAVIRWVPAWYVLTNRRAIEIRGVRAPRIAAYALTELGETFWRATPAQRMTRTGTVTLLPRDSNQPPQLWQSVTKPDQVHIEIRRAIDNAVDPRGLPL